MADLFSSMGSTLESFAWSSLGNVLSVVVILLVVILLFIAFFFFVWWKGFNLKVKIYQPSGQVPLEHNDLVGLKFETDSAAALQTLKEKKVEFDKIQFKKTHGKHTRIKGVDYFVTFMPMRRMPPIPMTMMYEDGIHLVQLSRDVMVPIPKPKTVLTIGANVSLSVEEDVRWKTWNNMMADRINNKYQDLDAQRKIAMYFVVGIVAVVLIGGFLLWLIYRSSAKGLEAVDRLGEFTKSIIGGGGTPA